jgi:hypothetical protein
MLCYSHALVFYTCLCDTSVLEIVLSEAQTSNLIHCFNEETRSVRMTAKISAVLTEILIDLGKFYSSNTHRKTALTSFKVLTLIS